MKQKLFGFFILCFFVSIGAWSQTTGVSNLSAKQGMQLTAAAATGNAKNMKNCLFVDFEINPQDSIRAVRVGLGTTQNGMDLLSNSYTIVYTGSDYIVSSPDYLTKVVAGKVRIVLPLEESHFAAHYVLVEAKSTKLPGNSQLTVKDIILKK